MPVNPWAAGTDSLLGFLAERDAKKRLVEDRARRDRLDAEAASDRQRMREIQEGQLRSVDEDRAERRRLAQEAADADKSAAKAKALNAEQIGQLLDQYTEALTAGDQNMVQAVGLRILNAGGKLPPAQRPPAQPQGFTLSPGARRYGPDGKLIASAPDRPKDGPAAPKPATGAQKNAAMQQAQRAAILEDRNGLLPDGVTVQQRAAELAASYLENLGVPRLFGNVASGSSTSQGAPPAAVAPAAGGEAPDQRLFNDAHAVVSDALKRDATPEEVKKFLSDPNNVAQLKLQGR